MIKLLETIKINKKHIVKNTEVKIVLKNKKKDINNNIIQLKKIRKIKIFLKDNDMNKKKTL